MFGMSRFCSYVSATGFDTKEDMLKGKEESIKYFVEQFQLCIEENYEDYIDNFNQYMGKD